MAGLIIPFPLVQRRAWVRRQAARMADLSEFAAQRHLCVEVDKQREVMRRRGVAPQRIERECSAGSAAVRAELGRLVQQGRSA